MGRGVGGREVWLGDGGGAAAAVADADLHNRRVERVEVEEQHELIVEASLRLQDEATRIRGLLTARLAIAAAVRRLVVVIVAAGIAAAASLLLIDLLLLLALAVLLLLLRHPHLVGRGGGDREG